MIKKLIHYSELRVQKAILSFRTGSLFKIECYRKGDKGVDPKEKEKELIYTLSF